MATLRPKAKYKHGAFRPVLAYSFDLAGLEAVSRPLTQLRRNERVGRDEPEPTADQLGRIRDEVLRQLADGELFIWGRPVRLSIRQLAIFDGRSKSTVAAAIKRARALHEAAATLLAEG